ncbi:MAG: hypothetical protein RLZZ451_2690, partial [Pseudomonadota bacterium]
MRGRLRAGSILAIGPVPGLHCMGPGLSPTEPQPTFRT